MAIIKNYTTKESFLLIHKDTFTGDTTLSIIIDFKIIVAFFI